VVVLSTSFSAHADSKRICRIVFPERPPGAPKVGYLFDGKKNYPVQFASMNFSDIIELPSGDLTLSVATAEISDPKNLPADAPIVKISENIQDFYLLLSPGSSNGQLRMNLVNVSGGALKPGETLWFNLTAHRIAAKLGESKMLVEPKNKTVSKSPLAASGYYTAELVYQPGAVGSYQRITEQQWWHDVNSRHVGFIVDSGGRLPKIYFYCDFRDPVDDPAKPD